MASLSRPRPAGARNLSPGPEPGKDRAPPRASLIRRTPARTVEVRRMTRHLRRFAAVTPLLLSFCAGNAALAQKAGGILKMYSADSPASMSIHEEATVFAERLENEGRLRVTADAELPDRIRHIKAERAAGRCAMRMVPGTGGLQTEEVDDPDLRPPPSRAFQIHVVQSAWR